MRYISILFVLMLLVFSGGSALAAGPWKGQVIDAETKEPLEGAVVLAVWTKHFLAPAGRASSYVTAKEALTDKEGRYEMPALRLISLPFIRAIDEPQFTIYKPGYGNVHVYLNIYAIDRLEIGYQEKNPRDAQGRERGYSIKRRTLEEGLIYVGYACEERRKAMEEAMRPQYDVTIDYLYIPMAGAREKIERLDVPLDCPEDSEPVQHTPNGGGVINQYVRSKSFRIVELTRLKTREERLRNVTSPMYSYLGDEPLFFQIGFQKWERNPEMKNYWRLRDEEDKNLGLKK